MPSSPGYISCASSPGPIASFLAAAVVLLASCEEVRTATQTVVTIDAEPELLKSVGSLRVTVWSHEGDLSFQRTLMLGSGPSAVRFPVTVPLSARGDDASRTFTLLAELLDAGGAVRVRRRLIGGYKAGARTEHGLKFELACLDRLGCKEKNCGGESCVVPCTAEADAEAGNTCPGDAPRCLRRPVARVALAHTHGCAAGVDGSLYCWGSNRDGRLGIGERNEEIVYPPTLVPQPYVFRVVDLGLDHSCGVIADGRLLCWGDNRTREIAQKTDNFRFVDPVKVLLATGKDLLVREIAMGHQFSCALSLEEQLYCWGDNRLGQLGTLPNNDTSANPQRTGCVEGWRCSPEEEAKWLQVDAGSAFACARHATGALYCWGDNSSGAVGAPSPDVFDLPIRIGNDNDWTDVAAGDTHTCGIREGKLYCWGTGQQGQLGLGTVVVAGGLRQLPAEVRWTDVAAGSAHSCAIDDMGALWCWGSNAAGELGLGDRQPRNVPVRLPVERRWKSVSLGSNVSCAIDERQDLYCWGRNQGALLPVYDANGDDKLVPTAACFGY